MSEDANAGKFILSKEQVLSVNAALWESLNHVVRVNNIFVEEMQKSRTLSVRDRKHLEQWSRSVAKATQRVEQVRERLNARRDAESLN